MLTLAEERTLFYACRKQSVKAQSTSLSLLVEGFTKIKESII